MTDQKIGSQVFCVDQEDSRGSHLESLDRVGAPIIITGDPDRARLLATHRKLVETGYSSRPRGTGWGVINSLNTLQENGIDPATFILSTRIKSYSFYTTLEQIQRRYLASVPIPPILVLSESEQESSRIKGAYSIITAIQITSPFELSSLVRKVKELVPLPNQNP